MGMRFMFVLCALLSSQAIAGPEGWIKLQTSQKDFHLYYQPLSVRTQEDGHMKIDSLINYSAKDGSPESLFSESLYNCDAQMGLDMLTAQHEGHWADGKVIGVSETTDKWRRVLPRSVGAVLMAAACKDPNSTQF